MDVERVGEPPWRRSCAPQRADAERVQSEDESALLTYGIPRTEQDDVGVVWLALRHTRRTQPAGVRLDGLPAARHAHVLDGRQCARATELRIGVRVEPMEPSRGLGTVHSHGSSLL